jgi:MYXO-CTERM domain-containing protein
MPVDQKGENILYVMKPGQVEAHIQIQYKGEAARFAWVLPVQALPEVEIGSQTLFSSLLTSTVPTFGFTTQPDFCGTTGSGGSTGGFSFTDGGAGVADAAAGPVVVLQKTVGAFDVTVLQGGTAQEVVTWLDTNGYQMPATAPALLSGYVAKNYLFVAVKLTGGAGSDEIHPLVVRYAGTEPCVPLKLTSVAAVEDMGVRTFFLGTKRVVPKNYKHITLNPVMIDWLQFAANYTNVVGRAADSPVANGHAFVTEYAGSSTIVNRFGLLNPQWDPNPFVTADPTTVMTLLQQQGLANCYAAACYYQNPLILPILHQYLPVPAGVDEGAFYSCLSCFAQQIDKAAWSGEGFAKTYMERIVLPGRHADDLLANWPYLTRMFTTLSPAEMTEDPEFQEASNLPDVMTRFQNGTRRITCQGDSGMTLPDGRIVALGAAPTWPDFTSTMPWAERIEEISASGVILTLVDNTEKIDATLKAWNDAHSWPSAPPTTFPPYDGGSYPFADAGRGFGGGTPGFGGGTTGSGGGPGATPSGPNGGNSGCACDMSRPSSDLPWALGVLTLLAFRRRRDHHRLPGAAPAR